MEKVKDILIKPEATIKQALKRMDETGQKILFVVDDKIKLLGTVTDGDIRKWIIESKSLNQKTSRVMNKNPVVLDEGYSRDKAKDIMIAKRIECIPIVDKHRRIISGIKWLDLFEPKQRKRRDINMPVVIMAGGEGTRLSPLTKILPKPLMPIGEKSIAEVIIDKFVEYGCKDFYLSVNYKANLIKAYFRDFKHDYNIRYIEEEKPLGTAGSLHLLKDKIKGAFFVINCDVLLEVDYADILDFHRENKNVVTLVSSMKHYTIPYGVCEIRNGGELKRIKEKPEYDFLVNTGMYVLEPEVLDVIPGNQVYHITDLINEYLKRGKKVGVYPISEKSWLDMGQWDELQGMIKKFEVK